MFAAQMLQIKKGQVFYTSGGMAPMGYSICAAIGAAFSSEGKDPIYVIAGDGGLHISIQALLLLSQYKLPIKIILLNNYSLGMIVQFQDLYFDSIYAGTTKKSGYRVPDFEHLAKAYYLEYFRINQSDIDDESRMKKILSSDGPAVIEFDISEKTIVSPKLQVNTPIEDLNPKLERQKLRDSMLIALFNDEKE
jgi:acetolactate synthase-1/2/3 large subunit